MIARDSGSKISMSIKEQRYAILEEMKWRRREFEEIIKKLDGKMLALRLQCPHSNQKWEPDPSGNNDSAYCCPDCGKQSKRKL